jgi:aspartate-semialdehyde dehydrogenase
MDILDNFIPYIPGEEAKIPAEARKILGSLNTDLTGFIDQPLHVSVACNRVPVLNGHTVCVSLRFVNRPPPTVSEVCDAMKEYTSEVQLLGCPSAPQHAIIVLDEADRPQPRLDIMSTAVPFLHLARFSHHCCATLVPLVCSYVRHHRQCCHSTTAETPRKRRG